MSSAFIFLCYPFIFCLFFLRPQQQTSHTSGVFDFDDDAPPSIPTPTSAPKGGGSSCRAPDDAFDSTPPARHGRPPRPPRSATSAGSDSNPIVVGPVTPSVRFLDESHHADSGAPSALEFDSPGGGSQFEEGSERHQGYGGRADDASHSGEEDNDATEVADTAIADASTAIDDLKSARFGTRPSSSMLEELKRVETKGNALRKAFLREVLEASFDHLEAQLARAPSAKFDAELLLARYEDAKPT